MNVAYLSCHSTLEFDELKLLTELGHNVISYGAYSSPTAEGILRPSIPNLYENPELAGAVLQSSKDDLHPLLIEWADVIIVMHITQWIEHNWEKIKHKRVVWRSIGQSIEDIEAKLKPYRNEGLQVVRYSPAESRIRGYIGADATIRFYKDKNEFTGWYGGKEQVITIAQHMCHEGRKRELNWDVFKAVTKDLPTKLFGVGNDCAGELWGGQLTYEQMKDELKANRVYFYTGTMPASYTLSFIEAMMTGIPIVAIGRGLAYDGFYKQDTYEVDGIIRHTKEGFIADSVEKLHEYCKLLLTDHKLAQRISINARKRAVELFSKEAVAKGWRRFL
jgi:predicted protein tyrosine phosphatase